MSAPINADMTYIQPLQYKFKTPKKDMPAICLPGCSVCCYDLKDGVGMTRKNFNYNKTYNSALLPGQNMVSITNAGAGYRDKFYAEIPVIKTDLDAQMDIAEVFNLLDRNIKDGIENCVHVKTASGNAIESLAAYYKGMLKSYNIDLNLTQEDMENINPGSYKYCEVHDAPRTDQCNTVCSYSARFFPKILKAASEAGVGEKMFTKLLQAGSFKDRFILVNYMYPRLDSIAEIVDKM